MTHDIRTVWSTAAGHGDYLLAGPSLADGSDLQTAVFISLFTDRQASADDAIPDGTTDRRGWWADDSEHPIGSRIWLLDRSKQTQQTLRAAHDYITEALQWLIDDGVVARFDIYVEWTRAGLLGAQVVPWRQDGTKVAMNYLWVWSN